MRLALVSRLSVCAVAGVVAGCSTQSSTSRTDPNRHLQPLSYATVKELEKKGFSRSDPILVRLYKQESEFEVWKQSRADGRFRPFKTYKICRWSGELGPKIKTGDKQAPEGFYTVTPAQMNPKSSYYLAFNTGYPNAFDRAHGRTGSHLMVHGDCLSAGCYAMTDAQMKEIYGLAREAFAGGQESFQLQAFPFRMIPENLARHRDNPHMAFWAMLKEGSDHFEVTRQEPKVAVCGRSYVFNAVEKPGLRFSPAERCPAYDVPEDIATAVAAKQEQDEAATRMMIARLEAEEKVAAGLMIPEQKPSPAVSSLASISRGSGASPPAPPALAPDSTGAARDVAASTVSPPPDAAAKREAAGSGIHRLFSRLVGRKRAVPPATAVPIEDPAPQPRPSVGRSEAQDERLPPSLSAYLRH